VTAKTGNTIDVRAITDLSDDLVIVSTQGQVIRLALKAISLIGRATQGVRIMKMNEGDKVASVALVGEAKLEEELEESAGGEKPTNGELPLEIAEPEESAIEPEVSEEA
jgi:DNA gyrase subunit A